MNLDNAQERWNCYQDVGSSGGDCNTKFERDQTIECVNPRKN